MNKHNNNNIEYKFMKKYKSTDPSIIGHVFLILTSIIYNALQYRLKIIAYNRMRIHQYQ